MRSKKPRYLLELSPVTEHTAFDPSARETARVDTILPRRYLAEKEGSAAHILDDLCAPADDPLRILTTPQNGPMNDSTPPGALPEEFAQRLQQIIPSERFADCWTSFTRPMATSFRINSLRGRTEDVTAELTQAGFDLLPLAWNADAFSVPDDQRRALTDSTACAEGRIYIQNPSSMIPPLALDPQPGEEVLDLAAAPGGKTLHMAALMENRGRIGAVEVVRNRFFRLRSTLERGNAQIVQTYMKDGTRVWRQCPERFDRVLLDAPCSGEGLFQMDQPQTFAYWGKKKRAEMVRKQRRLLYSAVRSLKPGGTLVYSTCTFAPEENEAVVQHALEQFGDALAVRDIELHLDAMQPGLSEWQGAAFCPPLRAARRIVPDGVMEGFFICKLYKRESTRDM